MKLKIFYIILILATLTLVSCNVYKNPSSRHDNPVSGNSKWN